MMFHGAHGEFRWLEASSHGIQDVLQACPEVAAQKSLVITLFDSGPLEPTPRQLEQGWRLLDSAVYVPAVQDPAAIPKGECDEWYIFTSAPKERDFEVFILYPWFTLGPASSSKVQARTRWDLKRLQLIFWQEIETLGVESYLACCNRLIFVTRNAGYFSKVLRGLSSAAKAAAGKP